MAIPEVPIDIMERLESVAGEVGGPYEEPEECKGSVGRTMFDTPTSQDETILVLLPKAHLGALPSQSIVRLRSLSDGRVYLGSVVRGPFAVPDGLRADAAPIVASSTRGGFFLPEYHGLVAVQVAGEEIKGQLVPPRFRPSPNSPVFALDEDEVRKFLQTGGDIVLGRAFGHESIEVAFDVHNKFVLPRHMGVLGTTGGGKSTTIAGMVTQLQRAGAAVVLIDTEGEYTQMNEPTTDPRMLVALGELGLEPTGISDTHVYHLIGRECTNPAHPEVHPFSPSFSAISPYAAMEIFDLTEAQEQRCQKAFDLAVSALSKFVWDDQTRESVRTELDEFDTGYPQMTLGHLYDVIRTIADRLDKADEDTIFLKTPEFHTNRKAFLSMLDTQLGNVPSWRALQGKVGRIDRLDIFDNPKAKAINYGALLSPGRVSVIDLADTDSTFVRNLVIADLLRGVQKAQEDAYNSAVKQDRQPTPVVIIVEEAHEFLSAQRIDKMPNLYQQVARIARRGRKRWLGLVFATQFPQHLPDEVLGLLNNYIIHKIGDSNVVSRLRKSIGGIDEALWTRVPMLAPGQAVVSLSSLTRPLLTAMSPAPCKLRMTE
jgi:hypothetical protein